MSNELNKYEKETVAKIDETITSIEKRLESMGDEESPHHYQNIVHLLSLKAGIIRDAGGATYSVALDKGE